MLLALCLAITAATAAATPANSCAEAYENTQRLRKSGALTRALEQSVLCAQTGCPAILRNDCVRWVQELEAALPSLVIDVRTAKDEPIGETQVFVDGHEVPADRRGRAVPLDPGPHELRVVAGDRTARKTVLVVEGRKSEVVTMRLPPSLASTAEPAPSPSPSLSSRRKAALALGVLALVGVASATTFGIKGLDRRDDLQDSCGGSCPREQREALERDFLIADLSLVFVLASGAGASWLWFGGADPP